MTFLYVAFDPDMLHFPLPFRIQAKWQGSVGYAQDFPTILISFDTLPFYRLCGARSRCASRGCGSPVWPRKPRHASSSLPFAPPHECCESLCVVLLSRTCHL